MKIYLKIHGISVEINSDDCEFIEYVSKFLSYFVVESLDETINIRCNVSTTSNNYKLPEIYKQKYGADLYSTDKYIRVIDYSLGFYCDVLHEKKCVLDLDIVIGGIVSTPRALWNKFYGGRSAKIQRYMLLIRQAIILPVFSELIIKKKWVFLHGSMVARDGKSLIFLGLNGCGKSGIARYLVENFGYTFMSDNYVCIDTNQRMTYCFPELLRLSNEDVPNDNYMLVENAFKKGQYLIPRDKICEKSTLSDIFIVNYGERAFLSELTPGQFLDTCLCFHEKLGETPEYTWPRSYYQIGQQINIERNLISSLEKIPIISQVSNESPPRF